MNAGQPKMQSGVEQRRRGEGQSVRILGQLEWKLTREDTAGHYCVLESVLPPGGGVPPHLHADQEAVYILEGSMEFARMGSTGLEWFSVSSGDVVNVRGGSLHGFRNTGATPSRMLTMGTGGLAAFFEEAGVPVAAGSTPAPPTREEVERVITIARKHGHQFPQ